MPRSCSGRHRLSWLRGARRWHPFRAVASQSWNRNRLTGRLRADMPARLCSRKCPIWAVAGDNPRNGHRVDASLPFGLRVPKRCAAGGGLSAAPCCGSRSNFCGGRRYTRSLGLSTEQGMNRKRKSDRVICPRWTRESDACPCGSPLAHAGCCRLAGRGGRLHEVSRFVHEAGRRYSLDREFSRSGEPGAAPASADCSG